ncbi:hypothetical protein GCM10007049_23780 [Echinicola pacifica]|uniref:Exodeoxyribonuclease VII small subunit n=1 Tax=Echinicola pacifica TaxID=346377 RepID=A0A918Q1U0_9BACT|nr:exodeoxyribonuclease VII small subunit [Echinicola pacifica]GGZ30345.1 hypothetical protein GCM10007049_23780 [Echinicola pacifica]
MNKETEFSYDKAVKRIEEIITELEADETSIDELSKLVKEASSLVKSCKGKLRMTEEEISAAFTEED